MAEYPIPPWLSQTPDWGGMAARNSAMKAQIAQSAQRMAQDAMQFQQQMEMRKMAMDAEQKIQEQQLKQQSLIAQHRLAVEQAGIQAKLGLEAVQLEQANRKLDMESIKMARDMQGEADFEAAVERDIAGGMTPEDAFRNNVFRRGVGAGVPAAAYSAVRKTEQANENPRPWEATLPSGKKMEGVVMGGTFKTATDDEAGGEISVRDLGQGLSGIYKGEKLSRVMKTPQFKFSRQKELDMIESGALAEFVIGGRKPLDKVMTEKVEAAKKIRQILLEEKREEEERFKAAVQRGGPPTSSKQSIRYDPSQQSYLTNSP